MTERERYAWAPEKYRSPNIKDIWWEGYGKESLKNFESAFDIAIDRFLSQPNLFDMISASKSQQRIRSAVIDICRSHKLLDLTDVKVNSKVKMNPLVDETWYQTVSVLVAKEGYELWRRPPGIKAMAEDAWLYERYQMSS